MTTTRRPTFVPQLDREFIDALDDTEVWRHRGITHWHLVQEVQLMHVAQGKRTIQNPARFDTTRIRALVDASDRTAWSPREALTWLAETWTGALNAPTCVTGPEIAVQRGWADLRAWESALESTWQTLCTSAMTPAGCGMATSPRYSLDAYAYPRTDKQCRRHKARS